MSGVSVEVEGREATRLEVAGIKLCSQTEQLLPMDQYTILWTWYRPRVLC